MKLIQLFYMGGGMKVMNEVLNTVTNKELKEYWKSFFPEDYEICDVEELIKNVSQKNVKELINEYNTEDESLIQSMIWGNIKQQELLDIILENLKEANFWVYFYEPILKKYVGSLFDVVEKSNIIEDKTVFLHQAIFNMFHSLHLVGFQTIIAEIYYAKQENILQGDNSVERGKYYNEVLLRDNGYRKAVYKNYPELVRILDIKVKSGIEFINSILKDTEREICEIENTLNGGEKLGRIKEITMGEGDTHNNGKSVSKLVFSTDKVIMYKPRSLYMEEKYSEFLHWLNNTAIKSNEYKLTAATSYSIKEAGWMEFIKHQECKNEEELTRFYFRVGMILSILYTTNAVDIHHENLIAQGDMPVLVDLETFIHPDLSVDEVESATIVALKKLRNSVTQNILLPTQIINEKNNRVFDLGGLSGTQEQESPFVTKFIENYGTDEVRIKMMYAKIEAKDNNPSIKGESIDSKGYRENIIDGFRYMYKWIMLNKDVYVKKINELFSEAPVRIVYRPTNVYTNVLYSSYHPDVLTNSIDREVFLHRLAKKTDDKSFNINFLEIRDMLRGDVPYFSVKGNAKDVFTWCSDDVEVKLVNSTIAKIQEKIKKMNEIDMYRQIAIINSKLSTEPIKQETVTEYQKNNVRKWEKQEFVEIAEKIADYLLPRSIIGESPEGRDRTWFGNRENEWGFNTYQTLENSLYYGLAGIALFFNYLEEESNNSKYSGIREEICNTILQQIPEDMDDSELENVDIGTFSGLAGVAYTLFYIDYSNASNKYEKTILKIYKLIKQKINISIKMDVIRELGIIGVMTTIYSKSDNAKLKRESLHLAMKVYEKVKQEAITIEGFPGITWGEKGYIGYAHGNAGVIAQLYRLYEIFKEDEIKTLIAKALKFERALYVAEEKNWKRSIKEQNFSNGWCHGAPGMLMSKLQLVNLGYVDAQINEEIHIAIETTINSGLRNDWCLCHGDMGNLMILKEAGIILNDNELYLNSINTIKNFADCLLEKMKTEKFMEEENNGFMVGLAGVGYELLRIGREKDMPNVMALE
ncbi:type 2 lantipeptide synthetase LanM [Bacillus thuringiensis]|nr:type 2 lantipeptide synthetase LanM [Bacillus thuringiensis]MRC47548.1 type 2 lantipeptide synthetase LanM [Bacillus thuringiensis]MRD26053.1 type 2 lantipeptide synthetase LanM [Bacillus thuringiensis]